MDNNLKKLKIIVSQEQRHFNKNDTTHWGYYNAYEFVLEEIDKLLKEKNE